MLLSREEFLPEAAALLEYVREDRISGVLAATPLTTAFYLIERRQGTPLAYTGLDRLLGLFEAAPVDDRVLRSARQLGFADYYEDAVLQESARRAHAGGIVTRNARDFGSAALTIYRPVELLATIETTSP